MQADPDKLLNQLVVAALTLFLVVLTALVALTVREIVLQQRLATISSDLQENLVDLEETTEQIQGQLVDMQTITTTTITTDTVTESISDVKGLLEDVGQQLDAIDAGLEDVAAVLASDAMTAAEMMTAAKVVTAAENTPAIEAGTVETDAGGASAPEAVGRDPLAQLFSLFAALLGFVGVVIALLLGWAMRVQQKASRLQRMEGH